MTFHTLMLTLAAVWVISAPIGYLSARWSDRTTSGQWTHKDRLFAIVMSALYGPLMPVLSILLFLLYKLAISEWGNRDAKW